MNSDTDIRIGDLLVREALLKKEDIEEALNIQQQERELRGLPLGRILVRMGTLSESDLERLLNHPGLRKEVGTIATEIEMITQEQLESCLSKKKPDQQIGDALIEEGLLNSDDIGRLLSEQISAPRLGELAAKLGLLSEKDLEKALKIQEGPRLLGEILCDLKLIDPIDLNHVLQKHDKQLDLGRILLDLGYVTTEQLNIARAEEKHSTDTVQAVLLRKNYVTDQQLSVALSKLYNIPFRHLSGFSYNESQISILKKIISQQYAEKNNILPISLEDDNLTVAVDNPESIKNLYDLRRMYRGGYVSCILISHEKFEELYEVLYSERLAATTSNTTDNEVHHEESIDLVELNIEEDMGGKGADKPVYGIQDIEIEELVNFMLKYGIVNGASDIHIEQDREGVKLRYRIDGVLRNTSIGWLNEKITENVNAVISRIKIMSSLDIAEKRLPQDGVFRINFYEKETAKKIDIDCRVASCRAIVGENVTIRILDPRKAQLGLEQLSHSPHVLDPLKTLLKSSAGMILVTGPTGSGKSSTLYGALKQVYQPGIKIITAEDPIEYSFPGIMQTQIKPKINLTFSRLLRSFLRLDPDVILVGEIRDEETAKIAFDAAQTGHLLLSTLHTNDSIGSVSRLVDLEVDHGQMASSLRCALAQRLVRRICSSCIQEYVTDEEDWSLLFQSYPSHLRFYKGEGCESCGFTGYKGRTVLSEIFIVDSEIARAMNRGTGEAGIRKLAFEKGMKTMLEDGLMKLDETTLSEIIRVVPHEMIKAFQLRERGEVDAGSYIKGDYIRYEEGAHSEANSFEISTPQIERELIDLMHERYNALVAETNGKSRAVDAAIFDEFVTDSYHHICEKYACKSVTFIIHENQGKAEISAIPRP